MYINALHPAQSAANAGRVILISHQLPRLSFDTSIETILGDGVWEGYITETIIWNNQLKHIQTNHSTLHGFVWW